ncbi:recombinase family protein, partial [Maritalea sp.]|uniref:recombinase family protein n=1 Tax=Maritalea sp. TaxID=2003361 RepID=UPI003EF08D91
MTQNSIQAVIYTRVSSKAQLKKGDGLASQESRCRDFAAYKGYDIVQVFQDEGVSGGLVDRPAIKSMLAWLRKHRNAEPVVIIDDISRLARDLDAHLKLRAAIGSVGAKLESPSIEFGEDSDSQLIENMLASVSQHHRQKNAEQVRHRMTARLKAGYFCFWVPTGYRYVKGAGGGKVLERDEPVASLLQEALEGFASNRFATQADVKRFLEPHPIFARDAKGAIHPQRIRNLLTNKIYAGYYAYKPWGIGLTQGKHPALIDWETFQRIQTKIENSNPTAQVKTKTEDFPLRGIVACASCNHPITGYWAKGRNKRYPYYECFQKACPDRRKSIKRQDVESGFEALLHALRPNRSLIAMASAMFRDIWDDRIATLTQHHAAQKTELKRIEADIRKAADLLIATGSAATMRAIEAKIDKLEAQKALISEDLQKSKPKTADFDGSFRAAMNFLSNPWKLWETERPLDRQTVLKLIFDAPIPYARDKGFRTAKTTLPFKVLANLNDEEEKMAERQGFEPWVPVKAQRLSKPARST